MAKVLIVDDDLSNRRVLELCLKKSHDIKVAFDGKGALDQVAQFQPDIILLDVMLPVLSGLEVCQQLRAEGSHGFAKIIMLSGRGMASEKESGYKAGADDYQIKPFKMKAIRERVAEFLTQKHIEECHYLKKLVSSFNFTENSLTESESLMSWLYKKVDQDQLLGESGLFLEEICTMASESDLSGHPLRDYVLNELEARVPEIPVIERS